MQNMVLGLEVSVISIIAVFVTLYLLAVIVDLFKILLAPKKQEMPKKLGQVSAPKPTSEGESQEELVAVITAAITAYEKGK